MKTKRTSFSCNPMLIVFFLAIAFIIFTVVNMCQREGVAEFGYIPIDEKVQFSWPDSVNQPNLDIKVVVIPTGDTVIARITQTSMRVFGGVMLQYYNYYPLKKDQKVFVKMLRRNSLYEITQASLNPRELGWRPK